MKYTKTEVMDTLRDLSCLIMHLKKQITTTSVPGLELVREDLGIRRPKTERKNVAHGQKHRQAVMHNRITEPTGMGIASDSPNVYPYYQEWSPSDIQP